MKKNIPKKENLEGRVEFIRKEEAMFFPKNKDKKYNIGQVGYYKNKAYEVVGRVIEYFSLGVGYYIQTRSI